MGAQPEPRRNKLIGETLVSAGLITQQDLNEALKRQVGTRERIVNILISMGALDSREFLEFLATAKGFTKVELARFDIDPDVIALVPKKFALENEVVPIDRMGKVLTVGMICPIDSTAIEELEQHTGLRVKPLLCSAEDVRATLERYYLDGTLNPQLADPFHLEAPLKLTTAVTMLRHIDSLPALPGTVQQVREMLYTESGSASEVAEIISRDPAIAAKMLRVANSAAYGLPHRVDNIQLAVSLLGLLETYSVVVSTAVINVFDRSKTFDYMAFWLESMVCATMASALSKAIDKRNRTGIFSAGLLHDIGRVALAEVAPRHYSRVDRSLLGDDLVQSEEKLIGLTHTEAGHQLAQHWGLPEELAEAIRFHHTPSYAKPEFMPVVAMVNIADVVSRAHRADSASREIDFSGCRESMNFLEVAEEDVIDIFNSIPEADAEHSLWSSN